MAYNNRMYQEYFGLLESPFSIAPDPRYLYMSERHREALAHLLYGMESAGAFILLTGEVGTGKTTVSRCLLEQVPEETNLALVLNPKLNALELLQVICDELHITYNETDLSVKALVDHINAYLLESHAQGRKTVVLIEEAQNLDLDVLEQLRLLTNLETSQRKLLQVILLGQPEFLDVLDLPELEQLAQRITARFHLTPLNFNEVEQYIGHRLAIAGCRRPLFAAGVTRELFHYSGGVPRLINVICDRALLGCYVQGSHLIDKSTLQNAAREVLGDNKAAKARAKQQPVKLKMITAFALLFLGVAIVLWFTGGRLKSSFLSLLPDHQTTAVNLTDAGVDATEVKNNSVLSMKETNHVDNQSPTQAFIQWPDDNQRLRSNFMAYQALFEKWGLSYQLNTDGTPCFYAQTQGLSCLHETSGIDNLRQLNRPAVLKLYDDFNQPQFVTLLGIGQTSASIQIADSFQHISLEQLLFYWKGEFSILWRLPPGSHQVIKPGSMGEAVVWLSKVMNAIDNNPEGLTRSVYDAELLGRVKDFQRRQGLESDGVVGVKTLIHINRVMGQFAPVLETSS